MGTDLEKGTTYSEGDQVNAANLNSHVDDAVLKYTAIGSKALKDPAALGDEILINDAGVLKKITLQQISSLVTIPPGTLVDFAGTTEPTGWLLCYGQAISRVTYSALWGAIASTYGAGDGSTTFNLPDCRGRVVAGKDNMGGASADRMTAPLDGDTLGAVGGEETHVIAQAEMAAHQHGGGYHIHSVSAHQHYTSGQHTHGMTATVGGYVGGSYAASTVAGSGYLLLHSPVAHTASVTQGSGSGWSDVGGATTTDSQQGITDTRGSSAAHNNTQPTIVFNKIIKT